MKIFFIYILLIIQSSVANSQDIDFIKTFSVKEYTQGECVLQLHDGYLIGGQSSHAYLDFGKKDTQKVFLMKLDFNGNIKWVKTFGGDTGLNNIYSLSKTSDDGYIFAGARASAEPGLQNNWLVKTDKEGEVEWERINYFLSNSGSVARSIKELDNKSYVLIVGLSTGTYISKIDQSGNIIWSRFLNERVLTAICQTFDNGFLTTGHIKTADGFTKIYLLRTDHEGNKLWDSYWGSGGDDASTDIIPLPDNNFILAGNYNITPFGSIPFIMKMDSKGKEIWTEYIKEGSWISAIKRTSDSGIIYTVFEDLFTSAIYLGKINAKGNPVWTRTFRGDFNKASNETQQLDYRGSYTNSSLALTEEGSYVLVGSAYMNYYPDSNRSKILVIKTDSIGEITRVNFENNIPDKTDSLNKPQKIVIYPNPILHQATFSIPINEKDLLNTTILLYNLTGKEVWKKENISTSKVLIDRTGLSSGLYIYRVWNNGIELGTGKIIIY